MCHVAVSPAMNASRLVGQRAGIAVLPNSFISDYFALQVAPYRAEFEHKKQMAD